MCNVAMEVLREDLYWKLSSLIRNLYRRFLHRRVIVYNLKVGTLEAQQRSESECIVAMSAGHILDVFQASISGKSDRTDTLQF